MQILMNLLLHPIKKWLLKASLSGVISKIHRPAVIGCDELIPGEAYSSRHIARGHHVVIFSGGKERRPAAWCSSHSAGRSAYGWFSSAPIRGNTQPLLPRGWGHPTSLSTRFVRDQWRCEGHRQNLHLRPISTASNLIIWLLRYWDFICIKKNCCLFI